MTVPRCAMLGPGLLLMVLPACGSDEPPPHTAYPELSRPWRDGSRLWPDRGPQVWDLSTTRDIRGADASVSDGSTGDGQTGSCPPPAAAKCTTACASAEICTEAKGGTCVKALVLSGPATDKAVLRDVAVAYVACWKKAPGADTLCNAFDTCAMTGALSDKPICEWVCTKAGVTDFPGPDIHATAREICDCTFWPVWQVYRPDWKISSVVSGKKGVVCLSYDSNPVYSFDKLNVNDCQKFPPL